MSGNLFYLGSPLLDISANCDSSVLKKYGLKPDDCVLAKKDKPVLFEELFKNSSAVLTPGGSAQNSARVSKWLLRDQGDVSFIGCVGKDAYAETMKSHLQEIGVKPLYCYHDTAPTGICACLVSDRDQRSMCTSLGAASFFNLQHLNSEEIREAMEKADILYVVGYFLSHSPTSVMKVAQFAESKGKRFALNLSATYVCDAYFSELMECMPYVDIVIGNEAEFLTVISKLGVPITDIRQYSRVVSSLPKKEGKSWSRIAVITRGPLSVFVSGEEGVLSYDVPQVANVEDTIGCGDALVGGFLAVLAQTDDVERAIRCGIYAAGEIAKRKGCMLPSYAPSFP